MPFYEYDINQIIKDDFLEYAGHVMQERSVPDARDGLKDGARKILYIQYKDKNTHTKNFIKGAAAVGQAMKMGYLHGDASAYGTLVRMGKRYAYPYPFEELQGNVGNQVSPDNHAHMRYLELRQSELASYLFKGIDKNTIDEWYDNYANTMQLPRVLPSIGVYAIVEGLNGIAVGLSTSYPSTNLREVNDAIIRLMQNPDISDEEIYCAPDFPMGGTIINGKETKESMLSGSGKSVKIRAKIEYFPDKNMLVATEIPFSVYTDTIDAEIANLINENESCGISKYIDATNDEGARINIYLTKGANVKKVINLLYKSTSLESFYGINLIMLEDGRFPKTYTWKSALQTYINHIRQCKTREIQFDLDKACARKNIVDGLIRAYSIIDDVVATIRASSSPAEASIQLINKFQFNEEQAKAILAMKLSSLTRLDIVKLNNEQEELVKNIEWCQYLLNTPTALDEELIKVLREVAQKYGDKRRTKILNIIDSDIEESESIKEEDIGIMLFDNNIIRLVQKDDLQGGKRGRKGINIKPPKNANLINTLYTTNLGTVAAFTDAGRMYNFSLTDLDYGKDYSIYELITPQDNEKVLLLIDTTSFNSYHNLITVSKKGYIKKTAVKEYGSRMKKGVVAVKLDDGDSLISVFLSSNDDDKVFIASTSGNYNFYKLNEISCTGRATRGVKAIKLTSSESIQSATIVKNDLQYYGILTITTSGRGKITPVSDFNETTRAIKGAQVMNTKDDKLAVVYAVPETQEKIFISANNKAVLLNIKNIPIQNRNTSGVSIIDAKDSNTKIEIM